MGHLKPNATKQSQARREPLPSRPATNQLSTEQCGAVGLASGPGHVTSSADDGMSNME